MKNLKKFNALIFTLLLVSGAQVQAQIEIAFAYVGDNTNPAFAGVEQGLTEANLQGQFLGQNYSVQVFNSPSDLPADTGHFIAFLSALESQQLRNLAENKKFTPILNLTALDNDLRSQCIANTLHIIPSQKMLNDAAKQWRIKHSIEQVEGVAWHHDFVKFAARDLNKRYRKKFDKGMDEFAWAGWAAVKMISDMVARESISDSAKMLNELKTNLSFDGQKGMDMNFRHTGQLRQPVLLTYNGKLLGEAPVRGVSTDIDSLGITACSK